MTRKKREQLLSMITEDIVRQIKPERIILFGSAAYGEPGEDSDVDLLIIKATKKPRWEREYILAKLLYPPSLPIDHIWRTPEELARRLKAEDFFYKEILERGRVLYET